MRSLRCLHRWTPLAPLLHLTPAHTVASCSWESGIYSPCWRSWSKNTCSLAGARPCTQVWAVWTHRVIPPPPGLRLCLLNGSRSTHEAASHTSVSNRLEAASDYACEGSRVSYFVSGGPSAPPHHVNTSYTLRFERAPANAPFPAPLPWPAHGRSYLFTAAHTSSSPQTSSSALSAHPGASGSASLLDCPHLPKLVGAMLSVWSVNEFQDICWLLFAPLHPPTCHVLSHIPASLGAALTAQKSLSSSTQVPRPHSNTHVSPHAPLPRNMWTLIGTHLGDSESSLDLPSSPADSTALDLPFLSQSVSFLISGAHELCIYSSLLHTLPSTHAVCVHPCTHARTHTHPSVRMIIVLSAALHTQSFRS